MKINIPQNIIFEKFNNIVKRYFVDVLLLKKQTIILVRQCDALLPRLMSGKLEVKTENE